MNLGAEEFVEEILKGKRNFTGIRITGFDFNRCKKFKKLQAYLKKQNFRENPIILHDSVLTNVGLRQIHLPFLQANSSNMKNADLQGANLEGANLEEINLDSANLKYSNLKNANLQDASLRNAKLVGANLQNANLEFADLREAKLFKANLEHARLVNANMHLATLSEANLMSADINGANLSSAYMHFTKLAHAKLKNANLEKAHLGSNDFTEADIRNIENLEKAFGVSTGNFTDTKMNERELDIIQNDIENHEAFSEKIMKERELRRKQIKKEK